MIVTIPLIIALVGFTKDVSSASISKVYVQNGVDYPVEYVQYGVPSVSYTPEIAQLNAAPVGSVVPYPSNYVPCGTPCVYPGQVAPVPSANVVQYQSPSLPVVVASPKNEHSGYEYSYVVYDEQTGDHKAQHELSDGSLVRGGYSFLQPDGFVREVQYVADDVQGFNAVVKNYLPVTVEAKKKDQAEKPSVVPCHEVKNDHLEVDKAHDETQPKTSKEQGHKPSHENLKAHDEEQHAEVTEHVVHAQPEAEHQETPSVPHEEHHEALEEHHEAHVEDLKDHHEEAHVETNKEHHEKQPHSEPSDELIVVIEDHHAHDEPEETRVVHIEETLEHHVVKAEQPHDEQKVAEVIHEVPEISKKVQDKNEQVALAELDIGNSNVLVPYNDILRCVQAALNGGNEASSPHKVESPLTYIILNKPC